MMIFPAGIARFGIWIVVLFVAGLVVAGYLNWPYGWDQGIYVWMAQAIRAGGIPYSEVWDLKGPAAIYLTALSQILFGDSAFGLRLFDLVLLITGATLCYRLSILLFASRRSAYLTAGIVVLWYMALGYWHTAQPDGWATWMLVSATLLVMTRTGSGSYIAAGALIGAAALVKPHFILFSIPVLLLARREPSGPGVMRIFWLGVAGGLVPVLAITVLLWRNAALGEALQTYFIYAPAVYSSTAGSLLEIAQRGADWLLSGRVLPVLVPLALAGWFDLASRNRSRALAIAVWVVGAVLLIVAQRWFFDYHILPALPWLSVLAGHGIWILVRSWREAPRESTTRNVLGALALSLLVYLGGHFAVFAGFDLLRSVANSAGLYSTERYLDGLGKPGNDYRVSRYLMSSAEPTDKILLWGMNTTILAESRLGSWGRFGFNMPLVIDTANPISLRFRSEFREAFAASRPDFIVFGESHNAASGLADDALTCALRRLVEQSYIHRFSAGPLHVYELRPSASGNLEPLQEVRCAEAGGSESVHPE